jgi:hypothetical protein
MVSPFRLQNWPLWSTLFAGFIPLNLLLIPFFIWKSHEGQRLVLLAGIDAQLLNTVEAFRTFVPASFLAHANR